MKVFATSHMHYEIPEFGIYGKDFPVISITGTYCSLKCKHCYGKLLERMIPVTTPKDLIIIGRRLKSKGVNGLLISGSCDNLGRVPFESFVSTIRELKGIGMKIFIHTGLIDEERAKLLKEANIDVVLLDVVLDQKSIYEVLNLKISTSAFINSLRIMQRYDLRIAPHIVIGLNKGLPSGEFKTIDELVNIEPDTLILVIFTPYMGTPFEKYQPPKPSYVIKVLEYARKRLREIPISLGCMRPRSAEYKIIEKKAVELKFDGIAFPSLETLEYMNMYGIDIEVIHSCCAILALMNK